MFISGKTPSPKAVHSYDGSTSHHDCITAMPSPDEANNLLTTFMASIKSRSQPSRSGSNLGVIGLGNAKGAIDVMSSVVRVPKNMVVSTNVDNELLESICRGVLAFRCSNYDDSAKHLNHHNGTMERLALPMVALDLLKQTLTER
jgi:hypothetical protein